MKVVIAGYYGFENAGDELILSSILKQIHSRYPDAMCTVLSASPIATSRLHSIHAISRWNSFLIVRELWQSDLLLLGGGGLLQDKTSLRSLLYYLSLLIMARVMFCRVLLYAVGMEGVSHPIGRALLRWVLRGKKVFLTVRDPESSQMLRGLGIPSAFIRVTADPVFLLETPTGFSAHHQDPARSTVLFIPRFPCPPEGRRLYAEVVRQIESRNQSKPDWALFEARREDRWLGEFQGMSFVYRDRDMSVGSLNQLERLIRSYDFVVSARFHGLVLAAMASRPFLGLGDSDKVGRFCHAVGMPFLPWGANGERIEAALVRLYASSFKENPLPAMRSAARQTVEYLSENPEILI